MYSTLLVLWCLNNLLKKIFSYFEINLYVGANNQQMPWDRVLLHKIIGAQLLIKFLAFFWTLKMYDCGHKNPLSVGPFVRYTVDLGFL